MASVGRMRKVLGMVKDQTSIGLARVASIRAPELEIVLVKATSHDDVPAEERHVQQILRLSSQSRGYMSACVQGLAKRLAKTRNWIVAMKALMLIHRLLKDGDPAFEDELLVNRRILNLSYFRDDSDPSAWDFSSFVRTYSTYISESLDSYGAPCWAQRNPSSQYKDERRFSYSECRSDYSSHRSGYEHKSEFNSYKSGYASSGYEDERRKESPEKLKPNPKISLKDMTSDMLFERIPCMQHMLDRVLACRPAGAAKSHRLVMMSLYSIIKESFQLYKDICDGITTLLDEFYEMEQHKDCIKAFDIYARSAKQFDELSSFYKMTKGIGICRPGDYPSVQKVSQEHLATLDEFIRDPAKSTLRSQKLNESAPESKEIKEPDADSSKQEEAISDNLLDLTAPPIEPSGTAKDEKEQKVTADLITFDEPSASRLGEHENRLALALHSTPLHDIPGTIGPTSQHLEADPFQGREVVSENGKAGWELALMSEANKLTKESSSPGGGLDRLTLDSLYEQATSPQPYAAVFPLGSSSAVALSEMPYASSLLALPTTSMAFPRDPFIGPAATAPPSYLQANDLRQKQQLLLQEQQVWQQYQRNSMQTGAYGFTQLYNNPYIPPAATAASILPQHALNQPYYGFNRLATNQYAS